MLVAKGQADVFLTYCTNAVLAVAEEPGLQMVDVPPAINVSAEYGLAVREGRARGRAGVCRRSAQRCRAAGAASSRIHGALIGARSIERATSMRTQIAHMPRPKTLVRGRDQRDAALALVEGLAVALEQHEHAISHCGVGDLGHEKTAR